MKWILAVDFGIALYVAAFVAGTFWLFDTALLAIAIAAAITVPAVMFVLLLVQGGAGIRMRKE